MGHLPQGQVTMYVCPPHRVRAVLEVLQDHGLAAIVNANQRQWLQLGDGFRGELPSDAVPALVSALVKAAPEAAFTAYAAPTYERGAGTTCSYVPDLGTFTAECDATGEVVLSPSVTAKPAGKPADVQQTLLGVPWRTAIAATAADIVTEPNLYIQYTYFRTWDHVVMDPANKSRIVLRTTDNWIIAGRGFTRAHHGTDLDEQSKADLVANNPSWNWAPESRITKTILYRLSSS
ncbi:hypothetical protein [Nocardia sp. NRRL S-836]|uniref:hypothetical protein n=1 Tax=Nocardia sp. NRRL S-836 TaxID=1519492 RepID=UPI0006AFCA06|nr:hypothetical protein [Nocardia sp. NRRL S-836]KOV84634.1 hypothetical protein ADL03_15170 [Nocardia sp. NRRL S-836]